MMNSSQEKAWDILTKQEKNSLLLQISHGQSSWEAGEIMKLSHYKYLELRERSVKFFKMFSEYFELNGTLIPPDCPVDSNFRDYVEGIIEKRLSSREARLYTGDSSQALCSVNTKMILRNMANLRESDKESHKRLYNLLIEFDRWNNKRVLPRELQLPSAYKRRNNNRDKTYLRYICNIPEFKVDAIIDIYKYKYRKKTSKKWYICLISSSYDEGYVIVPIKPEKDNLKGLSKLFVFVFDTKENADIFGFLITRFMQAENKSPKEGQKFFKDYREHIQRSLNYDLINKSEFYAETLDMAYGISNKTRKPISRKKVRNRAAKRADPTIFY